MKQFCLFVTALFLLLGCAQNYDMAEKEPPAKINVIKAKKMNFKKNITLYGAFEPAQDIAVSSSLQGMQILSTLVEVGDKVKKDQVLAYLENINSSADLAQNKANLNRLQAELEAQNASLQEANKALHRLVKLLKQNAVSKQSHEAQTAKVAIIKANIKSIKANIQDANAKIQKSMHHLNKTELKSPANGIIISKQATAGELIGTEPLFHIAKDYTLEFLAKASAQQLSLLKSGLKAKIIAPNKAPIEGEIRLVYPSIDSTTGLGDVRISLANQENIIIAESAKAIIYQDKEYSNVAIPVSAISFKDNGIKVISMVNKQNKIQKMQIITGDEQDGMIEVLSPMLEGEILVYKATAFVDDGDEIEPNLIEY